jgi:hypothetical protein
MRPITSGLLLIWRQHLKRRREGLLQIRAVPSHSGREFPESGQGELLDPLFGPK